VISVGAHSLFGRLQEGAPCDALQPVHAPSPIRIHQPPEKDRGTVLELRFGQARVARFRSLVVQAGAELSALCADPEKALEVALKRFQDIKAIEPLAGAEDTVYRIEAEKRVTLDLYKNGALVAKTISDPPAEDSSVGLGGGDDFIIGNNEGTILDLMHTLIAELDVEIDAFMVRTATGT